MMFIFAEILEGVRTLLTEQEYKTIRDKYLSGDEDGAIRLMDNIFKKILREYVKRRGVHNG